MKGRGLSGRRDFILWTVIISFTREEFRVTLQKTFLEAAVAGNVDYLVSGDGHLLELSSFRGIDIVTPRTFYDRLQKHENKS